MYYYIVDPRNIPQKNFERQYSELQSLLTEFNISGEIARITPLRMIQDLVDTAANRGATTLVACGTDETFNQMLVAIKDRDFTLSFIPFAPDAQLGRILGMTDLRTSVKTIAGRRIEKLDLAKINSDYFMSYLELGIGTYTNKAVGMLGSIKIFTGAAVDAKFRIDDSYNISSKMMGGLIANTRGTQMCAGAPIGNPQDGFLDLLLIGKLSRVSAARYKNEFINGCYEKIPGATAIRCKKIEFLEPLNYKIFIDGAEIAKAPAVVQIMPAKLKMIVGRNRTF